MGKEELKLVANNKKAYHDYFIEDKYEAGIALHGTEVKSLRMKKTEEYLSAMSQLGCDVEEVINYLNLCKGGKQ